MRSTDALDVLVLISLETPFDDRGEPDDDDDDDDDEDEDDDDDNDCKCNRSSTMLMTSIKGLS